MDKTPPSVTVPLAIQSLVHDFDGVLDRYDVPLCSDSEYMHLSELKFLVKNVRELSDMQLFGSYSKFDTVTVPLSDLSSVSAKQRSTADRASLQSFVREIDEFLSGLDATIKHRLNLAKTDSSCHIPRIIRLCEKLQLDSFETDLFHLIVVVQGSSNSHVLNSLSEEDYLRRVSGFQRLSRMSEVGIDLFCDSDRIHIKEGLVLVEEENGTHFNIRTPRTVVQLLYGRQVKADELLKVSQTTLEDILNSERERSVSGGKIGKRARISESFQSIGSELDLAQADPDLRGLIDSLVVAANGTANGTGESRANKRALHSDIPHSDRISSESSQHVVWRGSSALGSSKSSQQNDRPNLPLALLGAMLEGEGAMDDSEDDRFDSVEDDIAAKDSLSDSCPDSVSEFMDTLDEQEDGTGFLPYPKDNQLEYLEECFQMVALMVRGNAARLKDDMKKEGTKVSTWDAGDVKHGRRELQAKLRVHEIKVQRRVQATKTAGMPTPRLEVIAERLGLDSFEKKMVLLLIGKTVSPVVKTLMETLLDGSSRVVDDVVTVGQALAILCQDFQTQVANRRYFYRSGKLMTNGIISLSRSRWHQGSGDLTDNRIILDRRVLDWAVGLDSEINELVEGSDLYEPKVNLSQVVLPSGHLDSLLSQCQAYDAFTKYRESAGLQEVLAYGNSLVIMLCGKSGTGKTMTVNAIAKHLGKKVLLVDFGGLSGRRTDGSGDLDADLRGLFREAQMNNAVLFFDECETVFRNRNQGGDRTLNSLLTEIERHEGIVFLATNRPYDLDEAMHRRITAVVEYRSPDHIMRRKIWENLLLGANKSIESDQSDSAVDENKPFVDDKGAIKTETVDSHFLVGSVSSLGHLPSQAKQSVGGSGGPKLQLDPDIDIAAIAVKYELTGGFIKNAVLSALLSAISRDKVNPMINQEDLVAGCRLQMRGSLVQRSFDDKVIPEFGTDDLEMSSALKEAIGSVVRFEKARSCVYGSWESTSIHKLASGFNDQKACICALAGPSGSGKKTLAKAIAYDLGRSMRLVHSAELLAGNVGDALAQLQALINDAKLADAVIAIDGFEHVMEGEGGEQGSWKLHIFLSRILTLLHRFPGCVLLICHIDNPQHISLQRDFATKLFAFIRIAIPPHDVRAKLWRRMIPNMAPLSSDVSFVELGRRFDLNPGSIQSAVARACAEAAMRSLPAPAGGTASTERAVQQKDFLNAGEAELSKLRGGNFDIVCKLFT